MDIYLRSGEMDRVVKENDRFKNDLESLTKDYVTLWKANKSQCIAKTSVKWEAKVATLNRNLNQQKEEARTSKEKFMRARALASTYQRKNQRLEAQMRDARATKVENEALTHKIQELK